MCRSKKKCKKKMLRHKRMLIIFVSEHQNNLLKKLCLVFVLAIVIQELHFCIDMTCFSYFITRRMFVDHSSERSTSAHCSFRIFVIRGNDKQVIHNTSNKEFSSENSAVFCALKYSCIKLAVSGFRVLTSPTAALNCALAVSRSM